MRLALDAHGALAVGGPGRVLPAVPVRHALDAAVGLLVADRVEHPRAVESGGGALHAGSLQADRGGRGGAVRVGRAGGGFDCEGRKRNFFYNQCLVPCWCFSHRERRTSLRQPNNVGRIGFFPLP